MARQEGAIADASLFGQGGEMGALMRAVDWASTPLGPVAGWSQALRTMVGLLLRNRFPLLLWWGPDFVQLYNDAYRPIPGAKHPRSLGQPARECWTEIWHIIGPMIEAPFRGGPATWSDDLSLMIDRKGFLEETHFKVAYSPVPDETTSSGIGGVLATVAEITEEVYARRQLATLRDLAAHASDAKSAEQACETAARTLAANAMDIPYALLYLLDDAGGTARLAGCSGFRDGGPAAQGPPRSLSLGDDDFGSLVRAVTSERRAAVVDLGPRELPWRPGEQPLGRAVILPLASPDQATAYGALVAAASPHRELDESYRSFFTLAADHVASAIRNARAYQQERERAEKLAEIDRAKTLFFSNVSHEFRTPLTLMLAPIEDMRAAPSVGEADRERLDLLHRNGQRLLKLVNNLLEFSRIEAGRTEAVYEPTDLPALTAEIASNFRSAIERAGLSLVVECPPSSEPVHVDRAMWEKIVLNLLSNAFKFTFDGTIAVRLRAVERAVELTVSDTGIGIAEHELPRLFDRFHRIEGARSRSHEGSGIGLALVHELVRLHGGEIRVDSREGAGTAFYVWIPLGTAHLPEDRVRAARTLGSTAVGAGAYVEEALRWVAADAAPAAPARADGGARAGGARIVVADDNADMREYVARLLREHWDVEAVADGDAALAAIRREPPALVLSDVMMPRLDGFGLLRAVRGDPALRGTPFVLLSARAGEEATAEGLGAGADDYLVKPFTARELLVRVSARLMAASAGREVTQERANAEALARELRVTADRLEAAQAAAGIGIFDWDIAAGRVHWSAEVFALMGLAPAAIEPSAEAWTEAVFDGDRERAWGAFREATAARRTRMELEVRLKQPGGATRWVRVTERITYDGAGAPVRVLGAVVDIEELKRAAQARESERQRLLSLLEQVPAVVTFLRGPDMVVEFAQPRALAGLVARDVVGKPLLEAIPEYRDQPYYDRLRRVYETGEPDVRQDVPTWARVDGRRAEAYVDSAALPVRDAAGRIEGVMTFEVDVTRSVLARRELEAANRAKDEFLATMSHELRTPLNAVLGWTSMLRTRPRDESKLERGLEIIERNAKAQERIVGDLLDVSRIVSGKLQLKLAPTDIAQVVAAATDVVRPAADAKGVRLIVDLDPGLGSSLADADRLQQVVWNLLSNAVRFTARGGRVVVTGDRTESAVRLCVRDTGAGIAAQHLPHIFERFRQIDSSTTRAHGGLGLGLAIVRHLAEAHGGHVEAHSDGVGLGAKFTVILPLRAADGSRTAAAAPAASPAIGPGSNAASPDAVATLRDVRVLVVDDDPDSLELLREVLGGAGASVTTVRSAREALDARGPFDVIVSDIAMPEMDGYSFVQRIRSRDVAAPIPAIALTAYARAEDAERAIRSGFQKHLKKPVEAGELLAAVQRWTRPTSGGIAAR